MSVSKKQNLFILLAAAVALVFSFLPAVNGLTREGLITVGIFFASLIMWITVSIDWPSFITLIALGFLPSVGFGDTFKGAFGNSTVAFLIFTFMLVYPLSKTNFVRRCTVWFITNRVARKGPWFFVCSLFAAITFMGLFISPSVLFVAFMPFLEDIFCVLEIKKGGKTGKMIMMGTAFFISLSSGMTAIGHAWPTMAIGFYKAAYGVDINQFQYMGMGIPTGIVLMVIMILIFRFVFRPDDINDIDPSKASALKGTIPAADRREKIILATMALTILLWVGPSLFKGAFPETYALINGWTTAMPPMLGCIVLFLVTDKGERILNFKEASTKGIMWASILMTAAATHLGSCVTSDAMGVKEWLSNTLSPFASGLPVIGLIIFFFAWCILQTNFASNIVTVTIVSAIAISVLGALPAGSVNIGVVVSMLGLCAGICSMTPAGQSTINTVAIGSGWTTARDMFIWGGLMAILGIFVLSFVGYPIGCLFI